MPIEDFLLKYWPLILGLVGVVIWAVRVEGTLKKAVADIRGLWKQREEDQDLAATSRREVHDTLREVQKDIKAILREMPRRRDLTKGDEE
jgi:hypothetical protein